MKEKSNQSRNATWVKIEDTQYKLENDQIVQWLAQYGDVLTDVQEDQKEVNAREVDNDSDLSDTERDYLKCIVNRGCGTLKVKMIITKEIPQYIPMYGRKIRLYYRGIIKTCTNCYQNGHQKRDCNNKKRQWISYVMDFMNTNEMQTDMYGRWSKVVANELKYNGYKPVEPNDPMPNESDDEQESESETIDDETATQNEEEETQNAEPTPETISETMKATGLNEQRKSNRQTTQKKVESEKTKKTQTQTKTKKKQ